MKKLFSFLKKYSKESSIIFVVVIIMPLWLLFGAKNFLGIPNNFEYKADLISIDNFYDNSISEFKGEQYSKSTYSFKAVPTNSENLVNISGIFEVKSLNGSTIFKNEPTYSVDRITQQHVAVDTDVKSGYLFAPRFLKKHESFSFWHVSGNDQIQMGYVGEEKIHGLTVYKYKKINSDVAVDQTSFMSFLPGVPEKFGIKLTSEVDMWVEPVSGHMVKLEDYSTDYFYYDIKSGEKLRPYNKFLNTYTEESVLDHVNEAKKIKNRILFLYYILPTLLVLSLVIVLWIRSGKFRSIFNMLKEFRLIVLLATLGILVTLLIYDYTNKAIKKSEVEFFRDQSNKIERIIAERMAIYLNVLQGGAGLFAASDNVERDEWKAYVNSLSLDKNYEGVEALGFIKIVPQKDKSQFVSFVRQEGFKDFDIFPKGNRALYATILFIEPLSDLNKKALGYDAFSESIRRMAMLKARDAGQPSVSGAVSLVQDSLDSQNKGIIAFSPVYKNGSTPKNIEDRQTEIVGYTHGVFRIKDLMSEVLKSNESDLNLNIYDGLKVQPEEKIYSSKDDNNNVNSNQEFFYKKISTVYLGGHPWTIEFYSSNKYKRKIIDILLPVIVLLVGFSMTTMISWIVFVTSESQKKAVAYADKVTAELKNSVKDLENSKARMSEILNESERTNKLMVGRELDMIKMKNELKKFKNNKNEI